MTKSQDRAKITGAVRCRVWSPSVRPRVSIAPTRKASDAEPSRNRHRSLCPSLLPGHRRSPSPSLLAGHRHRSTYFPASPYSSASGDIPTDRRVQRVWAPQVSDCRTHMCVRLKSPRFRRLLAPLGVQSGSLIRSPRTRIRQELRLLES